MMMMMMMIMVVEQLMERMIYKEVKVLRINLPQYLAGHLRFLEPGLPHWEAGE
jgi:hypothetical protein